MRRCSYYIIDLEMQPLMYPTRLRHRNTSCRQTNRRASSLKRNSYLAWKASSHDNLKQWSLDYIYKPSSRINKRKRQTHTSPIFKPPRNVLPWFHLVVIDSHILDGQWYRSEPYKAMSLQNSPPGLVIISQWVIEIANFLIRHHPWLKTNIFFLLSV